MERIAARPGHGLPAAARSCGRGDGGAASVEHLGLSLLIAVLVIVGIASFASGPAGGGREFGFSIARKLRCAAQGPGPCWRDPLTEAYGRAIAGAVRALAPAPRALPGSGGEPLLPVDFRTCRRPRCATPGSRRGLTASNRRVTAFVAVDQAPLGTAISYWEYRPTLGWSRHLVEVSPAQAETLATTPLLDEQVPVLVALETLPGANHFEFTTAEEPPWRWQIERR